jgi:hypothetical protein
VPAHIGFGVALVLKVGDVFTVTEDVVAVPLHPLASVTVIE